MRFIYSLWHPRLPRAAEQACQAPLPRSRQCRKNYAAAYVEGGLSFTHFIYIFGFVSGIGGFRAFFILTFFFFSSFCFLGENEEQSYTFDIGGGFCGYRRDASLGFIFSGGIWVRWKLDGSPGAVCIESLPFANKSLFHRMIESPFCSPPHIPHPKN